MTPKYTYLQDVRTVHGEHATIYGVQVHQRMVFYDCWVAGRGMVTIAESKLLAKENRA